MNEDTKRLHNLVTELYKCRPLLDNTGKALVLFNVGTSFVAIGNDADKLYLTLGWEITEFSDGDSVYSYMVISPYGAKILQELRLNVEARNAGKLPQTSVQPPATIQQILDYLRMVVGQESLTYPIITAPVTIEGVGFIREVRITSLTINSHSVTVCIDNTELIELAKDHEWNFSRTGLALLDNLSGVVEPQTPYMVNLIQAKAQTLRNQRIHNTALYKLFLDKKRVVPSDTIVFIQLEGSYLTFDDDAIDVFTFQREVLLYESNVFDLRGRTVALLSRPQLETLKDAHSLLVVNGPENVPLYRLGLKESFLNLKCNHELAYSDVVIRKQKSGEYVISASYNSHPLPESPIHNTIGGYYSTLPSCKERSAILSSLVHRTYDPLISSVFDSSE